ncbi:MAG: RHS repeat protein [Oscillospiraceae bacterium]|nr:RHS repeat protein [Oscillospiraceae bacterium]
MPTKKTIHLDYDPHENLNQINLPDGSSSSWEYDSRGNCIGAVNP